MCYNYPSKIGKNMKKYLIVLTLLFTVAQANNFNGTGFGKSHKEAKKDSLSDLAGSIKSEVKSTFDSLKDNKGNKNLIKQLRVSSNLPIIGAEFILGDSRGGFKANSTLVASKAKILYEDKIKSFVAQSKAIQNKIKSAGKSQAYTYYSELLNLVNNYERYRSVAIILGVQNIEKMPITKAEVNVHLETLSKSFDNLSLALKVLTKSMKEELIYVHRPKVDGSTETTPFAKVVRDTLIKQLSTTKEKVLAKYTLKSKYIEHKNSITLSAELIDGSSNVIKSSLVQLDKAAYSAYETKAKSISFDQLLHDGRIISNKFRVSIKTASGDEDLLFVSGDETKLFVKLNNKGYFYIVGHVIQKGKKFSYLLDLSETDDPKFVQYVDSDDANRWMLLGDFTVEAPYGIESLQVIAANKEIKKIPEHFYDEESGYYILGKDPLKVVASTRGLKKRKSKTALVSEAVLLFTTMEK